MEIPGTNFLPFHSAFATVSLSQDCYYSISQVPQPTCYWKWHSWHLGNLTTTVSIRLKVTHRNHVTNKKTNKQMKKQQYLHDKASPRPRKSLFSLKWWTFLGCLFNVVTYSQNIFHLSLRFCSLLLWTQSGRCILPWKQCQDEHNDDDAIDSDDGDDDVFEEDDDDE